MARPKGSKNPNAGRKTSFKEEYCEQVYKLCLLGAKDTEIADFFEITEETLNQWKKKYEKFAESIKSGKSKADMQVAEKLYNRALGYDVEESHCDITEEIIAPITKDENGKYKSKLDQAQQGFEEFKTTEDAKTVKYKKNEYKSVRHIPAEVTAQIFWLKNRQKREWRDKQETGFTDRDGEDVKLTFNISGLDPDKI